MHHSALADLDFEGSKRGATGLLAAFPDIAFTVTHLTGSGELFAAHVRATGTHAGPLVFPGGTIEPTGRTVNATCTYHCRIVDGRIVEDWDVWTVLGIAGQIATVLRMPPRA